MAGLADSLEELARRQWKEARLLAGVGPEFPPRKEGTSGGDPARLGPDDAWLWAAAARSQAREGREELSHWLLALHSLLSRDDKGRQAMTPFYAPSGQMTLAGNLAGALKLVALEPGHILGAFTRWRRIRGFTGANLDHRAVRDAGVEPSGKPANWGAPGPTWLGLEGMGMARVGGRREPVPCVLWQRRPPGQRGVKAMAMVRPTWSPRLDPDGVRTLLEHPDLVLVAPDKRADDRRRELGITGLWRSERMGLSKSDGPLMAAQRIWPGPAPMRAEDRSHPLPRLRQPGGGPGG